MRPSNTRTSACLAARGGQEPDPSAVTRSAYRRVRPVGRSTRVDQVPLPVELLVALECIERLEHAEIGGRAPQRSRV